MRLSLTQEVKCASEAPQADVQAAHGASDQPTRPDQHQTMSSGQAGGGATLPVQVNLCTWAMLLTLLAPSP